MLGCWLMRPTRGSPNRCSVQDELVAGAESSPFGAWQRGVSELVELADQDGGHDPAGDISRNRLHADRVGDTVEIRGQLVGDDAGEFRGGVGPGHRRLWRRYQTDHDACPDLEIPARSTLRALALVELCRHGLAATRPAPTVDITLVINPDDGTVRTPDGDRVDPRGCQPPVLRPDPPHPDHPTVRTLGSQTLRAPRHPPPTPCPRHTRPRLSLPRLWRPTVMVRRPPPHLTGNTTATATWPTSCSYAATTTASPTATAGPSPPTPTATSPGPPPAAAPSPAENRARPRCCR